MFPLAAVGASSDSGKNGFNFSTMSGFGSSTTNSTNSYYGKVKEAYKIYFWKIDNFCTLTDAQVIRSPPFFPEPGCKYEFVLKTTEKDDVKYISFSIDKYNTLLSLNHNFRVSILNKRTEKFNTTVLSNEKCEFFLDRKLLFESENDILVDGNLIFYIEMSNCNDKLDSIMMDFEPSNETGYHDFLKNEKFSDVVISVGDKKISAHKIILAKKSKVFAAMFDSDMEESQKNLIDIKDAEYEVVEEMLKFMYDENFEIKTKEMAARLLVISDRYDIKKLLEKCEDYLSKILANDNAIDYLHLAHQHNSPNFRTKAFNYIIKHARKLSKMPDFKISLGKLPQEVIIEIVTALAGGKSMFEL